MAEYERPTGDFQTTVISTGSQLAAGGTTMTIGTGLTIPATNGVLQIDYDSTEALGAASGPETVSYAAYDDGTGAITGMTRGLAGTTGVTHENGASVQCGHSVAYAGAHMIKNDDLETTAGEPGGAWLSWTPTLSGLFDNAKWTKTCKYTLIGKTVHARVKLVASTTTPMSGSGDATFTLPLTAVDYVPGDKSYTIGTAGVYDSGTNVFGALVSITSTTAAAIRSNALVTFTSTSPMTWTTNDVISFTITYESA